MCPHNRFDTHGRCLNCRGYAFSDPRRNLLPKIITFLNKHPFSK